MEMTPNLHLQHLKDVNTLWESFGVKHRLTCRRNIATEIPENMWNMPELGQRIFPQDHKCTFELLELRLTMHWQGICREQSVKKILWLI